MLLDVKYARNTSSAEAGTTRIECVTMVTTSVLSYRGSLVRRRPWVFLVDSMEGWF